MEKNLNLQFKQDIDVSAQQRKIFEIQNKVKWTKSDDYIILIFDEK